LVEGEVADMKKKKIGVLLGGESAERDVSLKTGGAILNALLRKGYGAEALDMKGDWAKIIEQGKIDVAFIALHGRLGEDGAVQGLLEVLGIPFTGSGVAASAISMSKLMTKKILSDSGVKTPKYTYFDVEEDVKVTIPESLDFPLVVKPDREGSTIGISIVQDPESFGGAVQEASRFDKRVMIEEYVKGKEITVGLLNGMVLPAIEIIPKSGFYDYRAKYTAGATEYVCPAPVNDAILQKSYSATTIASQVLCLRGGARLDFRVGNDDDVYFLEINTIPGMTETSLLPKAALEAGIGFDDLVEYILLDAECGK
jgi:D-alanine-D-alanine ligase